MIYLHEQLRDIAEGAHEALMKSVSPALFTIEPVQTAQFGSFQITVFMDDPTDTLDFNFNTAKGGWNSRLDIADDPKRDFNIQFGDDMPHDYADHLLNLRYYGEFAGVPPQAFDGMVLAMIGAINKGFNTDCVKKQAIIDIFGEDVSECRVGHPFMMNVSAPPPDNNRALYWIITGMQNIAGGVRLTIEPTYMGASK